MPNGTFTDADQSSGSGPSITLAIAATFRISRTPSLASTKPTWAAENTRG